uniref:Si:ch211-242e8.1 n=1 Tax=Sinocyclocheilus anshuiensis TaxID=1608454 RepID=A0A671LVJ5_9TELE
MTTSDASTEVQSTTPKHQNVSTDPPSSNNTGFACISVLPPRRGSYYVEHGTGVSVGSMLVFWCKEGYQLVGHEKITCILHAGVPRWSSYLPVCESIPQSNDQGLRIALLLSVVSGVVILVMTVRRETQSSRSRRSPSWLEREHIDWEAFPPPKLFSLSQRLHRPLPPGSPVHSEVIRAYENRGYEGQESLLRSPHSTYPSYHPNSQIYPALVFQRVQTEPNPSTSSTSPVYIQISTPPKNKTPHAPTVTHPQTCQQMW